MTTITGAEFRDFYQNHWPEGCWHEDAEYEIEDERGAWVLADDRILELSKLGYVVESVDGRDEWRDFSEVWETWKGQHPEISVMSWRVPAALAAEVEAFMSGRGIEMVGPPTADVVAEQDPSSP